MTAYVIRRNAAPSRLDLAYEILRKGEKKKPEPEAEPVPVKKAAAKKPNQSKTAKPPRAKGGKPSKRKS